jgi:hypothetical protein
MHSIPYTDTCTYTDAYTYTYTRMYMHTYVLGFYAPKREAWSPSSYLR